MTRLEKDNEEQEHYMEQMFLTRYGYVLFMSIGRKILSKKNVKNRNRAAALAMPERRSPVTLPTPKVVKSSSP